VVGACPKAGLVKTEAAVESNANLNQVERDANTMTPSMLRRTRTPPKDVRFRHPEPLSLSSRRG